MYRFSRALYRILAPSLEPADGFRPSPRAKAELLRASEHSMARLANDGRHFRAPGRFLFEEIRHLFPIERQAHVRRVTDRVMREASAYLERLPPDQLSRIIDRHCQALTRGGAPCRRDPLPGRDYCPSHKHLESIFGATAPGRQSPDDQAQYLIS